MEEGRSFDVEHLRAALAAGRFEWRKHAIQRVAERGFDPAEIVGLLHTADPIEENPRDVPFPSALFLGWIAGKPVHIIASLDAEEDWAYIVAVYDPDSDHFEAGYRRRK